MQACSAAKRRNFARGNFLKLTPLNLISGTGGAFRARSLAHGRHIKRCPHPPPFSCTRARSAPRVAAASRSTLKFPHETRLMSLAAQWRRSHYMADFHQNLIFRCHDYFKKRLNMPCYLLTRTTSLGYFRSSSLICTRNFILYIISLLLLLSFSELLYNIT